MASTSRQDDAAWSDFDNLRHSVKSHTVDRLKQIITGLAEENSVMLSKTGKKQELIDRITAELERYRYLGQTENWARARTVLYQVRTSGMYTSSAASQTFTSNHNFALNNTHGSAYVPPRAPATSLHAVNVGASSIGRYDPYAPPRRPYPGQATASPVKPTAVNIPFPIRFKSSPFYRVEQAISSVVECPESTGTMDRRSQTLTFSLTQDHISKLTMPGTKYQLRLYCTTNTFYSPSLSGFRTNTTLCPIEFPATCEVRVNNTTLQANLKGIKKKPGTAPPADLSKVVRMAVGQQNRIEMIYVNSQQNAPPKKYYLVVFLVEASSVDQLIDRLRKGKFRTSEEIKAQMVKAAVEDDDIVIGKQKMTLKCPLSYTRITIPCRSSKCVHPQCFDAFSWYSVMEQTTTWLCPVCEKMLNPEELIVDGYFRSILEQTPESVEEVEVEPDGEWHTSDNKIGSKAWIDAHGSKETQKTLSAAKAKSGSQAQLSTSIQPKLESPDSTSVLQSLGDIVVLDSDSDNEDETRIKRELSPADSSSISIRNGSAVAPAKASSSAVIDLTLDSEDEDMPATAPVSAPKRKAPEALDRHEDGVYKRTRVDDITVPMAGGERLGNGYPNRGSSVSSGPDVHSTRSPYQGLTLPLPRQMSSSSAGSHHHTTPGAHSPPLYYPTHPPALPPQNARRFIPYTGPYQQTTTVNGSGVPYNGAPTDASRQDATAYNPYLPRPNGTGGSGWP